MNKSNILGTIGNTPIVELKRIKEKYNLTGRIFCKLEYLNPTHSKKDRVARTILELAKERGELKDGQHVVEATSGNTGIALSMVCAVLGHPFTAFMSEGNSNERIKMMECFNAEVIMVPQIHEMYGSVSGCDFDLVKDAARNFADEHGAYFVNQFDNLDNVVAQQVMGREIVEVFSNNIILDIFCDYIGTAGSFTGVSKELKKWNMNIKCYVIEPSNSAVLSGKNEGSCHHIIQGGGYGYTNLPNLDLDLVDGYISISDREAKDGMEDLAKLEGIFGSFSSGANLIATIKMMQTNENKNGIFTICDSGLKYLSVM